jgi:hypothetical protein
MISGADSALGGFAGQKVVAGPPASRGGGGSREVSDEEWLVLDSRGTFQQRQKGALYFLSTDTYAAYDQALESPPIQVSDTADFRISFDHAFQFQGAYEGLLVDKGLGSLEITTDDGASWVEVERFSGNSAGFPATINHNVNLGSAYASQTVRLRLRLLSQTAFVYDGTANVAFPVAEAWYLDNIQFNGTANKPLSRVENEDHVP